MNCNEEVIDIIDELEMFPITDKNFKVKTLLINYLRANIDDIMECIIDIEGGDKE